MVSLLMYSCIGKHRVDVWKTMTIAPGDSIVVGKIKAPAVLEIKNLSDENLLLVSQLKMQKQILARSSFSYRLPKKSGLILQNPTKDPLSIHLHYSSNKPIPINHKQLQ